MRLLLTLVGGTGPPLELELELAGDVTVGELADHLAGQLTRHRADSSVVPGATLAATLDGAGEDVLDRGLPVRAVGPRSGSRVRLVPPGPSPRRPAASPVSLVAPGTEPVRLPYGSTELDGVVLDVGRRVTLRSVGPDAPSVNGVRVLGHARLAPGDLVWTGRRTVEVRVDGPLRPPAAAGPTERFHRAPERRLLHRPVEVELPTPPSAVRRPGFPVLSAAVPLLMGVALWAVTRSAASAAFVVFSFVFVVASGIEARRESAAEERFRVREYRTDLAARLDELRARREAERRHADHDAPATRQVTGWVRSRSDRLWERTGTAPEALRVRVGVAAQPAADRAVLPNGGRRDLLRELRAAADELATSTLPVVVDLDATGGLVVAGADDRPTAVARAVVAQLTGLLGPDQLALRVLAAPARRDEWRWCRWLPHASAGGAARTLVLVDGADPDEAESALVHTPGSVPLWLSSSVAGVPPGIRALLVIGDGTAELTVTDEHGTVVRHVGDVGTEELLAEEAAHAARSLAPLRPARTPATGAGPRATAVAAPDSVRLGDLTPVGSAAAVREQWERSATTATLGAPIGRTDGGVLSLDLRDDGPHALVAGTTGAGKSELLRTLVASLALHHGPDRLNFLLVDYKGGAAFGPLSGLPHTVGVITDLDRGLAARALRSLRAEVRRREHELAGHGAADVAELDARARSEGAGGGSRLASLVVVVDEFATLARDLPEFVDGLVDVAQRGRSLGIHLVLATQRPAGVVTDAIRANAALRIALRVADEDDSLDVVDVPDAAHLPREVPGRAVVRVGPGRSAVAQVAWSGGADQPVARVRSWPLGERDDAAGSAPGSAADSAADSAAEPAGRTELEAAVDVAGRAARDVGVAAPRRPWVDPLPARVELWTLPPAEAPGRAAIGWADRPDEQRRDLLEVDLDRDGGVLVLGAPGAGASTALRTLVHALRAAGTPLRVHGIDAGTGLAALRGGDVVGDVVPVGDGERVLRLLRATDRELRRRMDAGLEAGPGTLRRLLLVDGYGPFEELYERVNRGEAVDLVARIARDGRRFGIHVAIAARRRGEVPAALVPSLGLRLDLRCATVDEAALAGLPDGAADAEVPPGRGHVGGVEVQVALPSGGAPGERSARAAPEPVPALPRHVPLADLRACSPAAPGGDPWLVPVGVDADDLATAHLDLRHHHAVVAGPPRSGVTTALSTIAAAFDAAHLLTSRDPVADGAGGPQVWASAREWSEAAWAELLGAVERDAAAGRRTLLALDRFCELVELPGASVLEDELARLLRSAAGTPLRVVVGGDADGLLRCYSDVATRLRGGRTGLLLQPDPDLHAGLLQASLPRRDELPACAGRGWVLGPGTATPLQVAVP